MQYVFELENVDFLVDRYKEYLESTTDYSYSEILDFADNGFKNSKVSDVDYLFDDMQVDVIDGEAIDLTYKSQILEMMDEDYSKFVQSLISIETKIIDKEVLDRIYDEYRSTDNITLISEELYNDPEPRTNKREGLLDKMNRIEKDKESFVKNKDEMDLER